VKDASGNEIYLDGKGNINIIASEKNITITAPKDISLNAENIYLNATAKIRLVAEKETIELIAKRDVLIESIDANILMESAASLLAKAGGDIQLKATGKLETTANEITAEADSTIDIKAAAEVKVAGSITEINGAGNKLKLL